MSAGRFLVYREGSEPDRGRRLRTSARFWRGFAPRSRWRLAVCAPRSVCATWGGAR